MPSHRGPVKGIFAAIGAGTAISAIAGAYKFSEFLVRAKKLHGVGPEAAIFQRLLERVHSDLTEARRLVNLEAVQYALSRSPEKVAWINSVMKSTRLVLELMGPFTERVAGDTKDGGHVGVGHRMRWVLDEKGRLVNHNYELVACHQSLTQVLSLLVSLEPLACCIEEQERNNPPQTRFVGNQTRVVKEREIDVEVDHRHGAKREIDIEVEHGHKHKHKAFQFLRRHEGGPKEIRVEKREIHHEGPPREVRFEREIRREGRPEAIHYEADFRGDGPLRGEGAPRGDFRYTAEVRREGPPLRGEGVPREVQYRQEIRRDGGHEEWIEQRETRPRDREYFAPDPRDVPRATTWPRSRL